MPLPMPRLDSRTYDQLVEEARVLLPRLAPGWTDHNVHDPGITLIELFAWLVEMDFYRLDRTSAASYRAFLRLVGIEPRPAQVAETTLIFGIKPPNSPTLPAGFQVGNADGSIVFQTVRELVVSPASLVAVLAGSERELTPLPIEKPQDKRYPALGSRPRPGQALYLGFDRPLAEKPVEVSLYVWTGTTEADRETRKQLIAGWEAEQAEAICPPGIEPDLPDWRRHYRGRTVWEYHAGEKKWAPLAGVVDETRGLTLSGPVRFLAPEKSQHAPGGVKAEGKSGAYFIRCRLVSGGYECPPQIQMISLNAASARHTANFETPEKWGDCNGRAGQVFRLPHTPVVPGSTQVLIGKERQEGWKEVWSWDRVGPHDRAYVLSPESGEIIFGNGRHGRVPPAGAEIRATYQVGGGSAGNVAPNQLVTAMGKSVPAGLSISQPFAAIGGAEAETLAEAKGRAMDLLAKPRRAITLKDFEDLALATPGVPVARAHAIPDYDPAMPCLPALGCVTVVVVPRCPDPRPEPSPEMLRAVSRYLERRRMLTTEVRVIGPSCTTVAVRCRLHLEPDADTKQVKEQARLELDRFFHPLHGGPESKGWPIGRDVYRSEVMALLNALPGVTHVDEVGLQIEGEVAGCCGSVTFQQTIRLKDSAITIRSRLQVEPNVLAGELVEQIRIELEKYFQSQKKSMRFKNGPKRDDAQRPEVMALLRAIPGVTHVDEVGLRMESGAVCENVSVCPHGLVASGQHQITVVQEQGRVKIMQRPAKEPCAEYGTAKNPCD